ncbi:hypothetical protein EMCG_00439 [[Emmonsia] crescens]|uniref:Uncharacterized protein n=1 Tax=[Emmonsia] crescens TaxID=73230 RepID=A0A0G2HVM0_9EURO|nr:hypothetical protein EMCG_00439 [Emmonsia crescens UAMH 3008]
MDIIDVPSIPKDLCKLPRNFSICNVIDKHMLCSGEEIELTTIDPRILQRLTSLSAAADTRDDVLDDVESEDPVSIEGSYVGEDESLDEG